jgi:hypothetical protein
VQLTRHPGVNKIYMGFKRFNMRVNYLVRSRYGYRGTLVRACADQRYIHSAIRQACTNRRSACLR